MCSMTKDLHNLDLHNLYQFINTVGASQLQESRPTNLRFRTHILTPYQGKFKPAQSSKCLATGAQMEENEALPSHLQEVL